MSLHTGLCSTRVFSSLRYLSVRPHAHQRLFTTSPRQHQSSSPFGSGPAPPRLPKEEQEVFDRLQRSSTGAFSTPRPAVVVNQSPQPSGSQSESESFSSSPQVQTADAQTNAKSETVANSDRTIAAINARVEATGKGEELHPDVRRGAKPEFEGEVNPKTGEVGGPKNEPLRWGGEGDWSYNGRVTDF